ncbi:MAG: PqiC family protein, partial [Desulfobacterales bacterium]
MMRTGLLYKIIWLIALFALLLSGCRGSTPKTEFYTLNSIRNTQMDAKPISAGQPLSIGVGPVTIPQMLDRPQIVSRTGPYTLQIDEFHRWAGRLNEDFARVLAENISLMLATEQVDVY